jgi:hypothetical protein
VAHSESVDDAHHIYFAGPLVSFNLLHVTKELSRTPASAKNVYLHLTENVTLVDHTSCESLLHFVAECHRNGTAQVELRGLDEMKRHSEFPSCMRTRYSRLAAPKNGNRREGDQTMTAISPVYSGTTFNQDSERIAFSDAPSPGIFAGAKPEDGLTWLSLSESAADASADASDQPRARRANARATMDWLDLERASGGAVGPADASCPS